MHPRRAAGSARGGRLRIIAGRFRGRLLTIPDQPGLRPTPDRVRETLFNWLAPLIGGAHCLDAFAGTGALGLEAASRGASRVVLVERSEHAVRGLQKAISTLGVEGVEAVQADTLGWLADPGQGLKARRFDLVFLDPPFESDLLGPACDSLARHEWLAPGGLVFLETARENGLPVLPDGWEVVRTGAAGQVLYALATAGIARAP